MNGPHDCCFGCPAAFPCCGILDLAMQFADVDTTVTGPHNYDPRTTPLYTQPPHIEQTPGQTWTRNLPVVKLQ